MNSQQLENKLRLRKAWARAGSEYRNTRQMLKVFGSYKKAADLKEWAYEERNMLLLKSHYLYLDHLMKKEIYPDKDDTVDMYYRETSYSK